MAGEIGSWLVRSPPRPRGLDCCGVVLVRLGTPGHMGQDRPLAGLATCDKAKQRLGRVDGR
jgi:hypothetical protein